jgi:hypothetical protein
MPTFQKTERLTSVKWADSQAVNTWRDNARVQAMNALSLANHAPEYIVFGVRNSKSLLGLIACHDGDDVQIVHFATRDTGKEVTDLLIGQVVNYAGDKRIRAFKNYSHLKWRKVGKEYWSK